MRALGLKTRSVFQARLLHKAIDRGDAELCANLKVSELSRAVVPEVPRNAAQGAHVNAIQAAEHLDVMIPRPGVERKARQDKGSKELKFDRHRGHGRPEHADCNRRISVQGGGRTVHSFAHLIPTNLKVSPNVLVRSDNVEDIAAAGCREMDAENTADPAPLKRRSSVFASVPDDGLGFALSPVDGEPETQKKHTQARE
eukprot:4218868-Heterocapsa_arctica.AAC.1